MVFLYSDPFKVCCTSERITTSRCLHDPTYRILLFSKLRDRCLSESRTGRTTVGQPRVAPQMMDARNITKIKLFALSCTTDWPRDVAASDVRRVEEHTHLPEIAEHLRSLLRAPRWYVNIFLAQRCATLSIGASLSRHGFFWVAQGAKVSRSIRVIHLFPLHAALGSKKHSFRVLISRARAPFLEWQKKTFALTIHLRLIHTVLFFSLLLSSSGTP